MYGDKHDHASVNCDHINRRLKFCIRNFYLRATSGESWHRNESSSVDMWFGRKWPAGGSRVHRLRLGLAALRLRLARPV